MYLFCSVDGACRHIAAVLYELDDEPQLNPVMKSLPLTGRINGLKNTGIMFLQFQLMYINFTLNSIRAQY
jgi:hypothetical protein